MYKREEDFIHALASITIFTAEEMVEVCKDKVAAWGLFEKKVSNTAVLLSARHIFVAFVKHILRKFIKNGYQRVEFRAELTRLTVYGPQGQFIGQLPESGYSEAFD